jgi:uncharacterized short protein YbdD (DUF466 family)
MKRPKLDGSTVAHHAERKSRQIRNSKLGNKPPRLAALAIFAFRVSIVVFSALWQFLRALTGDDAYERYVLHGSRVAGHESPLSASEFYLRRLEHKYSGPSRCC